MGGGGQGKVTFEKAPQQNFQAENKCKGVTREWKEREEETGELKEVAGWLGDGERGLYRYYMGFDFYFEMGSQAFKQRMRLRGQVFTKLG